MANLTKEQREAKKLAQMIDSQKLEKEEQEKLKSQAEQKETDEANKSEEQEKSQDKLEEKTDETDDKETVSSGKEQEQETPQEQPKQTFPIEVQLKGTISEKKGEHSVLFASGAVQFVNGKATVYESAYNALKNQGLIE